jgi:recombinational DNA repair ATPase RecF
MKIKKIELKDGYKRFHHLTIDLGEAPARIVGLVGPNGCGKSSVLDGIMLRVGTVGNKGGRDHTYHSMFGTSYDAGSSILIDLDCGSLNDKHEERVRAGKRNTMLSFRSSYRYNSQVKITSVKATSPITHNGYGASVAVDLDDKMEENYRRLHAKYNHYRDSTDSRPSEAKAKIIGDLNASLTRCLELEVESLGNIEANQGTLYFKKADHPKPFEFNVLSSGEKEAVDILLDLYLRQDDYDDTIFLIDEPELHISTATQRKLLVEINRLIGPNCQLWITTHSVGFLRALQEDLMDQCQIIHFEPGRPYAAERITLRPIKPTPQVWRDIFETALDDLAGLVSPRRIIYCEGRAEPGPCGRERGLDAQVLNEVFAGRHPSTQFISSGGNTELDQRSAIALAVLSKVFPTVDIWVLKDRDIVSGRRATERDRQRYLKENEDTHRVLKRFEIENYLFDEDVLKAYCASEGLTFDAARYGTLVGNVVDDDVKSLTGAIKKVCGIDTSISPERFKLNLAKVIKPGMAVYEELEACIFQRQ